MREGEPRILVLAYLAEHWRDDDSIRYGYQITKWIQRHLPPSEKEVRSSTISKVISALESEGLIVCRIGEAADSDAGSPRKLCTLTDRGVAAFEQAAREETRRWAGIDAAIKQGLRGLCAIPRGKADEATPGFHPENASPVEFAHGRKVVGSKTR